MNADLIMHIVAMEQLTVSYTNYRGETANRIIKPMSIYYGSTEWHKEPQWLVNVWDVEKQAARTFALKDMKPV